MFTIIRELIKTEDGIIYVLCICNNTKEPKIRPNLFCGFHRFSLPSEAVWYNEPFDNSLHITN